MKIIKITFDTNLLIELFDLKIKPKTIPSVGKILKHCFDWQKYHRANRQNTSIFNGG
jgi:hypothetical protein